MARRVSLPKADDLFRSTTEVEPAAEPSGPAPVKAAARPARKTASARVPAAGLDDDAAESAKKPSGRVKHDAKMTVYISDDELLELEHARLQLRRSHGIVVDRGRMVREALALVLADLEAKGPKSPLVKRLLED